MGADDINRSMVEPLFTREHIDGMRPHIQQTVNTLIDEMIIGGGKPAVDIVEKLALPTASYVSAHREGRNS